MTFDYAQAARRHHQDAMLLLYNQRAPNADQLYGYAAECALVGIVRTLLGTDHLFNLDGEALERDGGAHVRRHIDALWRNFWLLIDSHGGKTLMRGIDRCKNPFDNWSIKHRYFADAHCNQIAVVEAHRDASARFLAALQEASSKKPRRAARTDTQALPDAMTAPPEPAPEHEGGGSRGGET
jgi:hypothetical protein